MIKSLKLIATCGMLSALGACASYQIAPASSPGIEARYNHGRVMMLSQAARGTVAILPVSRLFSGNVALAVVAQNNSGYPINLGYENVVVRDDTGKVVELINADQMASSAKGGAILTKVMVAIAAGLDASTINKRSTSHYSARGHSAYGNVSVHGEYTDAGLADEMAMRDANWVGSQFASIDQRLEAQLAQIDQLSLQTSTVDDKSLGQGLVWMHRPEGTGSGIHKMSVEVNFAGDVHRFSFYVGAAGVPMPADQLPAFSSKTLASSLPGYGGRSALPQVAAEQVPVSTVISRF